jgi:hypothetical protein
MLSPEPSPLSSTELMKAPQLLTSSRCKVARACRRKHLLRYIQGYRSVQDAAALRFGTLMHHGLEAWWLAVMAGGPQDGWLTAALVALAGESDPGDLARAQVLMTGYHLRWKDEPYEVLAVEVTFNAPLVNPVTGKPSRTWRLAGKVDVVVRDLRTGKVLLVEHKTSSEDITSGSSYWKRLRLDGQVSIYFVGARSLGFEIEGCLYDVIGKIQQRPLAATPVEHRKYTQKDNRLYKGQREVDESPEEYLERIGAVVAEAPETFFARGEVVRLDSEITEAMLDVWDLGQQLREEQGAERYPRNPDSCDLYHRQCEFFGVCTGEASLDDERLFLKSDVVHPELEKEAA